MLNNKLIILTTFALTFFITTFQENIVKAQSLEWNQFKNTFIEHGKSKDPENGYTHSEGQAYSMLLAIKEGDEKAFSEIWYWTKSHLQREDKLLSWKWQNGKVADPNNATDADIMIAWALIEAGKKWDNDYFSEGLKILSVIEQKLIIQRNDDFLILPALHGFQKKNDKITINMSYWVWPAISEFKKIGDRTLWSNVEKTGIKILNNAASGPWSLISDWTSYPELKPDPKGTRASYDAMRIPLYLIWNGMTNSQIQNWKAFWEQSKKAWVDTRSGEMAQYPTQPEHQAILNIARRAAGENYLTIEDIPVAGVSSSYYASVIVLLTKTAWTELFLN